MVDSGEETNQESEKLSIDSDHYEDPVVFRRESVIDEIIQGEIVEVILRENKLPPDQDKLPKLITDALKKSSHRKNLRRKLNYNLRLKFPIIGKPSSAFLFIGKDGKTRLQFLRENDIFREDSPHGPLRIADEESDRNQYSPRNLLQLQSILSGHIANITPEYSNDHFSHMMLTDKFTSNDLPDKPTDKRMISALMKNGILPIGSNGSLIT